MPYSHPSSAQAADDLAVLHAYLSSASLYFASVKRRLLSLSSHPSLADIEPSLSLLSEARVTLLKARLACGPGSIRHHHRRAFDGGDGGYVVDLLGASEPLTARGSAVREAWETLLRRTNWTRSNAVVVAMGFANEATTDYLREAERFAAVLGRREREEEYGDGQEQGRGQAQAQGRGRGRGRSMEVAVKRARERAQDLGPLARVHPSRRKSLRRAMEEAKAEREAMKARRRRRICFDL